MVHYSAFFQPTVGKGWYSSYPGDSCKDIYYSGYARGDGEYWIDPEKNGNPLKVFCDMTRAGGEYWCSMVITERTYTLRSGYKMDDWGPGHPDPDIRRGPGLKKKLKVLQWILLRQIISHKSYFEKGCQKVLRVVLNSLFFREI